MNFVSLRSNCTLTVLNMVYKHDLIHLQKDVLHAWHTIILWQSLLIWLTASDEIRVFDIQLICPECGFKRNLRQINKFVCLRLAYCLSVSNMDCKHDSQMEVSLSCNSSLIKTFSVHEFGQPKVFVYWRWKYTLFSQHMNSIRNEIRVSRDRHLGSFISMYL